MTHTQALQARARLLKRLPSTSELLRGSLIERTTVTPAVAPSAPAVKAIRKLF